ncbi:arginase [Rugamonas rubra]|uniref:Arginase n=1 Tax=Rugamonas rubra TaxID=758825 RepID=A0A1I4N5R3_9BURK|nr:arginase [Rugamonas rubra]
MSKEIALTVFQARAGDHNDLAMPGAAAVGAMLAARLGLPASVIGRPEPALNSGWRSELDAALPALRALAEHHAAILRRGAVPLTAATRCAVSLAMLPVVASQRPDACVVWFDAHADFHTPHTSASGYLGGMVLAGACGLWDSGLGAGLAVGNVVLVGGRDIDPAEQALIDAGTLRLVTAGAGLADELRRAIAGRPVYLHLDCDVLEPGIVPTDYRCTGGLSLAELGAACAVVAEHELVGVEIAEFEHAWQAGGAPVSPAALLDALRPLLERLPAGA